MVAGKLVGSPGLVAVNTGFGSPTVQVPSGSPSSWPLVKPSLSESKPASTGPQPAGAVVAGEVKPAATAVPKELRGPPVRVVWQLVQPKSAPLGSCVTRKGRASTPEAERVRRAPVALARSRRLMADMEAPMGSVVEFGGQ